MFWFTPPTAEHLWWAAATGAAVSCFVFLRGAANFPAMALLWALYHSLVNVGQTWYSFGETWWCLSKFFGQETLVVVVGGLLVLVCGCCLATSVLLLVGLGCCFLRWCQLAWCPGPAGTCAAGARETLVVIVGGLLVLVWVLLGNLGVSVCWLGLLCLAVVATGLVSEAGWCLCRRCAPYCRASVCLLGFLPSMHSLPLRPAGGK